jgi:hypothetical protein
MQHQPTNPITGPLLALLRSRKFLIAVATLLVDLLIAYVPAFEGVRAELLTVFTVLGTTLIAAIAYEDGAKAQGGAE